MELIVVPPDHYDIKESYNTRMRPHLPYGRPDKKLAYLQWAEMAATLRFDLGVNVHYLEPTAGLDDEAFACDSGLWIENMFIAGLFEPVFRRGEKHQFMLWFCNHNRYTHPMFFAIKEIENPDARFEGGDCLLVKDTLLVGYGERGTEGYQRTNGEGIKELIGLLSGAVKVIPVRRITKEFYHLNSVMAYYPSAELLAVYPDAFHPDDLKGVEQELKVKVVRLRKEDVYRHHPAIGGEYLYSYCLNSIENNGKVLMPYVSDGHGDVLTKHSLTPLVPKLGSSEFEKSGGSYRCLTMIHNIV